MIGLDYEEFTEHDAAAMANATDKAILKQLRISVESVRKKLPFEQIDQIVISGSGSFLAQRLAETLVESEQVINLHNVWGEHLSGAACAVSLVKLAQGLLKP